MKSRPIKRSCASATAVITSSSRNGNIKAYTGTSTGSTSKMRSGTCRSISSTGATLSRELRLTSSSRSARVSRGGGGTDNRLAGEYGLRLIYKKRFHEVLEEEQSSRDFGPLLKKMGVLNDLGESSMDEDQWEAASEFGSCAARDAGTDARLVHGICIREGGITVIMITTKATMANIVHSGGERCNVHKSTRLEWEKASCRRLKMERTRTTERRVHVHISVGLAYRTHPRCIQYIQPMHLGQKYIHMSLKTILKSMRGIHNTMRCFDHPSDC